MLCFPLLLLWHIISITCTDCTDPFRSIPGRIKFVHPALSICPSPGKGDGVFVIKDTIIPMGSVLIVEDPLIDLSSDFKSPKSRFYALAECTESLRSKDLYQGTSSNTKALDSLCIAENFWKSTQLLAQQLLDEDSKKKNKKTFTELQINDIARFHTNAIGGCCHEFTCKLNHGFPTNVAMTQYGSHRRMVVFATKDLHLGEELQFDYFGVIGPEGSSRYKEIARGFGIDILGADPFRNKLDRGMMDELAAGYKRGELVLDPIIDSGLVFKLYCNGYNPNLIEMTKESDGESNEFVKFLKEKIKGKQDSVPWEMYSVEAWESYGKSSVGRAIPRKFMGMEYTATLKELQILDNCQ